MNLDAAARIERRHNKYYGHFLATGLPHSTAYHYAQASVSLDKGNYLYSNHLIAEFFGEDEEGYWEDCYQDNLRPSSVKEIRRRGKSLRVQNRRRRREYYQGYAPWNLTKRFGTRNYEYPEWHPSHWSHEEVPMGFYFKNKLKPYLDPWGYSEHHNVNALRQPQMWDKGRLVRKEEARLARL